MLEEYRLMQISWLLALTYEESEVGQQHHQGVGQHDELAYWFDPDSQPTGPNRRQLESIWSNLIGIWCDSRAITAVMIIPFKSQEGRRHLTNSIRGKTQFSAIVGNWIWFSWPARNEYFPSCLIPSSTK